MSEHGDSDVDATEEINVDDSDSRSCSPRNYASHDGPRHHHQVSQETSECSTSPPPSQTASTRTLTNDSPRSHPFSISRLLGESGVQSLKSPSSSEEPDSDREKKWSWEEGNNNNNNDNRRTSSGGVAEDGRQSWGHDAEEKLSEKDDDDTGGSTPDIQRANSSSSSSVVHCASATVAAAAAVDLLAPFRLFPTGTTAAAAAAAAAAGLIYTGSGVIRVPAHRPPPGANGAPAGNALTAQAALIPPWSLQALQHSQQQQQQAAAAAGLHRASLLANLAASHPLQAHPHLKDRLAGR